MKTVFLLLVVFTNNGYEQIGIASNQEFDSAEMCEIELESKEDTANLRYFCGDKLLFIKREFI